MVIFFVYICKRCLSLQWRLWMLIVGAERRKGRVLRVLGGVGLIFDWVEKKCNFFRIFCGWL